MTIVRPPVRFGEVKIKGNLVKILKRSHKLIIVG